MRTFTKNKRNYRKKIGCTPHSTEALPDDDEMQEDGDEFTDSGAEGGTSGVGKRKKVAQGGTSKKARM